MATFVLLLSDFLLSKVEKKEKNAITFSKAFVIFFKKKLLLKGKKIPVERKVH